jgi:hypothetical protein
MSADINMICQLIYQHDVSTMSARCQHDVSMISKRYQNDISTVTPGSTHRDPPRSANSDFIDNVETEIIRDIESGTDRESLHYFFYFCSKKEIRHFEGMLNRFPNATDRLQQKSQNLHFPKIPGSFLGSAYQEEHFFAITRKSERVFRRTLVFAQVFQAVLIRGFGPRSLVFFPRRVQIVLQSTQISHYYSRKPTS